MLNLEIVTLCHDTRCDRNMFCNFYMQKVITLLEDGGCGVEPNLCWSRIQDFIVKLIII
jgi:hypothetical protein